MTAVFGIMALVGCCGIPLTAVNLLIRKVQEKPTKRTLRTLFLMAVFLFVGVLGVNFL
ncbi:MAG: hypothetical protein Q4B85_04600 [Lachnospiraceae bacterium]|nr:hypothetical protein [Lachnospiraceae bacterium]